MAMILIIQMDKYRGLGVNGDKITHLYLYSVYDCLYLWQEKKIFLY